MAQRDRPFVRQRRNPGRERFDALDARLDLDVASHALQRSR
jgi:hypothetical protein